MFPMIRKSWWLPIITGLTLASIIIVYLAMHAQSGSFLHKLHKSVRNKLPNTFQYSNGFSSPTNGPLATKWVVVTSIFEPTKSIKMLSQMEGWQVVVVGDKKTPLNWSWPNVIYLSVEDQEGLGYRLLDHLAWNSFPRKALGYLYAIQHGAELIYETDDDNAPIGELSTFTQATPYRLVLNKPDKAFNPHVHFGQSSTWPRGYPLDKIGSPVSSSYILCPTPDPPVVQSLVNGDPDIDAIYRLTRRFPLERIDVKFDEKAPLFIYPYKTYTPYNCQNTLFRREAFWSLVLPITVTDRATDIFRAYWAERLMALVGQRLAFGPASFYQLRSQHNLLKDFDKEIHVYLDTDGIIEVIDKWKCTSHVFSECILEVTRVMIDAGFYKEADYDLISAWLEDLQTIDPSLLDFPINETVEECMDGPRHEVVFFPNEQLTTMPHDPRMSRPEFISSKSAILKYYRGLCNNNYSAYLDMFEVESKPLSHFVLVVSLHGASEDKIMFFMTYYKVYFDHILFCSESKLDHSFLSQWKSSVVFFGRGELNHASCMSAASKIAYNATGFFFMPEHMMLNVKTQINSGNKHSYVWLPKKEDVFLSEDQCTSGECLKVNIEDIEALERSIKKNSQSEYSKIEKPIKRSISFIEKEFKERSTDEIYFFSDFPAYLPKSASSIFYQLESAFGKASDPNDPLLLLLFYLVSHSGNDLELSKYSPTSESDFYVKYVCSYDNVKCLCDSSNFF